MPEAVKMNEIGVDFAAMRTVRVINNFFVADDVSQFSNCACVHFWPTNWNYKHFLSVVRVKRTVLVHVPQGEKVMADVATTAQDDGDMMVVAHDHQESDGVDVASAVATGVKVADACGANVGSKRGHGKEAAAPRTKKSKGDTGKREVTRITLVFVKMALDIPLTEEEHADLKSECMMADWKPYVDDPSDQESVQLDKVLLWVVPSTAMNKTLLTIPEGAGVSQYLHVLDMLR